MEVGVDNTLRRKMFRVGGEVNTHGVGITSGLEYRRPGYNAGGRIGFKPGGSVDPIDVLFEKGSKFVKPLGVRGKILGGILAALNRGRKTITSPFKKAYTKPLKYIAGDPSKIAANPFARFVGRSLRTAGTAGAYGLPVGITSAIADRFLPGTYADPDSPVNEDANLFEQGLRRARQGGELATDLLTAPGVAFEIGDVLFKDPKTQVLSLTDRIAGRERQPIEETVAKPNVGSKDLATTTAMKTAMTQEEQLAKMTADAAIRAEMYYNMLSEGGPDKVRALADAFTNAGMLYDEDKSKALAGFSQGITGELDKDAVLKDEARRLGLTDIVTGEQTLLADAKAKAQAIENAKLAIASSTELSAQDKANTLAQFEAYLEGIREVLPINQDNEMDTNRMNVGRAYFDAQRITGGVFVAVNSEQDIQSFNSAQEALAHAAS